MIYKIAGLRIKIDNRYEYTDKFCAKYLDEDQFTKPQLNVFVSDEDMENERIQSPGYSEGYIENICLYRNLCVQLPVNNRFLLHSAILDCNGEGLAFLGHSGAGKTTHTSLWLKYVENTKIINGDKPIIHFNGEHFIAYGTPWMGKEFRGCNSSTVIKGMCFIEKAKENKIIRLNPQQTANRLFTQILIPTDGDNAGKTLELIDAFIAKVPAYVLYCDISENAVKTSYEVLLNKEYKKIK